MADFLGNVWIWLKRCAALFLELQPTVQGRERLYGRHKGRPLRARQHDLLKRLLPKHEFPISDGAALRALPDGDLWLEIGFGGGEHLAAQAMMHPHIQFIGAEFFINGVAQLLAQIEAQNLSNIRIHPGDVRQLLDALPDTSVSRVFLLFPDPWPKKRHHERRIVSSRNLDRLVRIMKPGSILRIASDDTDYISWILRHLSHHKCFRWLDQRSVEWLERPADWPETRYEAKAKSAGRQCVFLSYLRV